MAGKGWIFAFLSQVLVTGFVQAQDFQQMAEEHFKNLGYPVPKVFVTHRATVSASDVKDALFLVAENSVTLDHNPSKQTLVPRFSRADPNYHAKLPSFLDKLAKAKVVEAGDTLVDVRWDIPGTVGFATVGVLDGSGKVKFEPVLSFTLQKHSLVPITKKGSWVTRYGHYWRNGLGIKMVEVDVEVSIDTIGCSIANPEPHITFTQCLAQPLFEAVCNRGEQPWCRLEKSCQTQRCQQAQDCIKYATQVYIASGMDDIQVDLNVTGEIAGIKLDGSFKIDDAVFGGHDKWEHVGDLCALKGDPLARESVGGIFVGLDGAETELYAPPVVIDMEEAETMGISGSGSNRVVTDPPEIEKPLKGVR